MTYSIKYIEEVAQSAKKLGFRFVPLLDPTADLGQTRKMFADRPKFKVQKAASVEILMRQMLTHFPASLVIYNGKILDPFIFGAMTNEEFEGQVVSRIMNNGGVKQ